MHVHQDPSPDTTLRLLEEYISRPFIVQIIGQCSVEYQGRAQSKLDRGERLLIVKQDNALLIHGPEKYQPKNWQPETDKFITSQAKNGITLESVRKNPEERVITTFSDIDIIIIDQLVDKADMIVKGHEIDIHKAIEKRPDIIEDDLTIIEREKKTPAGYIDIFARDQNNALIVIEVKRNPNHNSVIQLKRYVDEIENEFPGRTVRGILVAPDISDTVQAYLEDRSLSYSPVDMEDIITDYKQHGPNQSGLEQFGPSYDKSS